MGAKAAELAEIHAAVCPRAELLTRRRAVYQLAVQLASASPPLADLSIDVIDNPMVRQHLGAVLGGQTDLDQGQLTSMDSLVIDDCRWDEQGQVIRLASSPAATAQLPRVLEIIEAGLQLGDASHPTTAVLDASKPGFPLIIERLRRGTRLALAVAPDLLHDLLPHVALLTVLSQSDGRPLGSASLRQCPGLLVLPEPESDLEVAEALIHEGAHQKFFDLAIVGSIFTEAHAAAPEYVPRWATPRARPWPLEQCLAAFHAYSCLAAFAEAIASRDDIALHSHSLLPHARMRAYALGDWVDQNSDFLGPDGQHLASLLRSEKHPSQRSKGSIDRQQEQGDPSHSIVYATAERRCGEWILTMKMSRPAELSWRRAR